MEGAGVRTRRVVAHGTQWADYYGYEGDTPTRGYVECVPVERFERNVNE